MQDFYSLFLLNPQPMLLYYPAQKRIGITNEALQVTYGYTQEELSTMDLPALESVMPLKKTGTIHQRKDGTWLQVEVSRKDLIFDGQEAQLVLIRDITTYKQQEEELRQAKQRAEEASHAKELFLASVSHEIRTPMNAIMGMSYLLEKTILTPQQKIYNDTIKVSAENLLIIINDILDMSKISAGKMTLESVGFKLTNLIENLGNTIRYRAEEKGIGLFTEIDRRITPILLGDPLRLNQILLNLVSNAIKFTDKGQVEIECKLLESTQATHTIQFKVIDSGKGIDKNKLEKIFEAFSQEDESISREYGGTGLGLSISKNLVHLFGSKLEVESTKSTGTTFAFTLELGIGDQEDLPQKQQEINITKVRKHLEELRVLLVEDHEMNLFVATSILAQWGIKPDIALNGKEALKRIRQYKYDIVLMDIQMPIMGGIEATKIIRKDIKSDVIIVALTANAIKTDIDKYLSVGMNKHLAKPFEPSALLNIMVETIVTTKKMDTIYNLPKVRQMFDYNEAIVKKMLALFVEKTPQMLQQLEEAYAQKRYVVVSQIAHKLKSSVKTLGADILGIELQTLEEVAIEVIKDLTEMDTLMESIKENTIALITEIQSDL